MIYKQFKRLSLLAMAMLCPLTLKAFEPAKPFPDHIKSARYVYSEETINKGIDMIMGSSVNEDLRFVFTGHQKGNNISFLFGVVGVLATSTANGAAGQKAGSTKRITHELAVPECAESKVLNTFASSDGFQFNPNATARFEIIPYAFLAKNPKTKVSKLHAMLKVKLYEDDQSNKPIWLTRFFGESSGFLTAEELLDSKTLAEHLNQAFERAAWGMEEIINDRYESYQAVNVKAQLAGMRNDKLKLAGLLLSDQDDTLLLRFPYGKLMPLAGYSVLDKDSAEISPLKKFKDKYRKDFER